MKFKDLFEMPERIQSQEIQMPWKSADLTKRVWSAPLRDVPNAVLACHPMKQGSGRKHVVVAYVKTEKGLQAAGGMLVHMSKSGSSMVVNVDGLTVLPAFRGKGIAYSMYTTMVFDKGFVVVSDDVQTDGGAALWNKLAHQFPDHVGAFEDEVEDAVALDQWKDGNPLTNPFTQLVISPTPYKQSQVA